MVLSSVMKTRKKNSISGTPSKTSDNASESSALPIPTDLIIDIFSRLPLKTIAICRCVSKPWASTLRLQDFTQLFFTKSSARPPQILFARQKDGNLFFFSSPQPQNPDDNSSVSADPLMSFIGFGFDKSCIISGLVHGLVCLVRSMAPVLCSPTTGQALVLPKVKTRRLNVKCLLGYDPVDKQFKVLSMTQGWRDPRNDMVSEEHQVLTLGTGKMSWRTIQCSIPHLYPRDDICIDGVLYYTSPYRSCMIVCFDVRSEKFRFIEVEGALRRAVLGFMVNCNGKLGLIVSENKEGKVDVTSGRSARFKLWVLEDVDKQEWSERTYVLPAEWKNVVGEELLKFVGLTRTNEIVLSSWDAVNPFYLFYFSLERNTVVRVEIQGVCMDGPCSWLANLQPFLDHVEDVKLYAKIH
ncbi:hypothetical protein Bca4012_023978 [Brassica carinata]